MSSRHNRRIMVSLDCKVQEMGYYHNNFENVVEGYIEHAICGKQSINEKFLHVQHREINKTNIASLNKTPSTNQTLPLNLCTSTLRDSRPYSILRLFPSLRLPPSSLPSSLPTSSGSILICLTNVFGQTSNNNISPSSPRTSGKFSNNFKCS